MNATPTRGFRNCCIPALCDYNMPFGTSLFLYNWWKELCSFIGPIEWICIKIPKHLCIQKYISLHVGQPRLKWWHSGTQTASDSANFNNFWKSFTIPIFFVPICYVTFPNCPTWVTYNDIVHISAIFHKISEETNISFKTRKLQTMSYFRHNKQESYMMQI